VTTAVTGVGQREYRDALRRLPTGVSIVTATIAGQTHGMTVNSLTSVSLEPPVLLVCLTRDARTTRAVQSAGRFAVSVLAHDQAELAAAFARPGERRDLPLQARCGGAPPVVDGAVAQVRCRVYATSEIGDHLVVYGLVTFVRHAGGAALGFVDGRLLRVDGDVARHDSS
jgi:flavin reductase (DIM6/NTAB) family NADH-FMN oxidoreductase RutF